MHVYESSFEVQLDKLKTIKLSKCDFCPLSIFKRQLFDSNNFKGPEIIAKVIQYTTNVFVTFVAKFKHRQNLISVMWSLEKQKQKSF